MVPSCNEPSRTWQVHGLDMRTDSTEQARRVQEAQEAHLQKDLSDGLLCAVINNNTRCYNESTEFADHLDDALAPPYKARSPCQPASACAALKTLSQQSLHREPASHVRTWRAPVPASQVGDGMRCAGPPGC